MWNPATPERPWSEAGQVLPGRWSTVLGVAWLPGWSPHTRICMLLPFLASFLLVPPSPTYLEAGNKAGGGRWMDGEGGEPRGAIKPS